MSRKQEQTEEITDLTRGVYRRIYAGYLRGKRINAISLGAEAWFWRLNAVVDDFGNFDADPLLVHGRTAGKRAGEVSAKVVAGWLGEMIKVGLVVTYEVAGEMYLHIAGYTKLQPKPKNGRQVRKYPAFLGEKEDGAFQVNPGESGCHNHHHHHHHNQRDPAAQGSDAAASPPASAAAPVAPPAPAAKVVLEFPCIAGKRLKAHTWALVQTHIDELTQTFPAVDVPGECRKALTWVRANPLNKKTADRMGDFLFRWMKREQNSGRGRALPVNGTPAVRSSERIDQLLEGRLK